MALRRGLGLPPAGSDGDAENLHELVLPIRLSARGGQPKLLIGSAHGAAPDADLLNALARAHRWLGRLASGEIATVQELARAEGVDRTYVSRGLQLAFLAPDIVDAILDGRQPVELTLKQLLREPLPRNWAEQRRLLACRADDGCASWSFGSGSLTPCRPSSRRLLRSRRASGSR